MPVTLAAVSAGVKGVTGIAQFLKGRKLAKQNARPTYEIPEEIKQNLSTAQMQALEGLPQEQVNQYLQNIGRSQNFALGAINERKGGLAGLGNIVQSSNDAYSNLMVQDAIAKQQNIANLVGQRNVMADYKDKQFQYNKVEPYQEKAEAATALKGAGLQNLFNAIDTGVNLSENKALGGLYGDGTGVDEAGNKISGGEDLLSASNIPLWLRKLRGRPKLPGLGGSDTLGHTFGTNYGGSLPPNL